MKQLLSVVVGLLTIVTGASAETYKVDAGASTVAWEGKKVTGAHNGYVKLAEGKLEISQGNVTGGEFQVDLNTLECADLKDASLNQKLITHLKSDDFFSVAKFPRAVLKIKSAKALPKKANAPTHEVIGGLTVKGVTHPITFPATLTIQGNQAQFSAALKIDRTKWNIRYGSGKFFQGLGDKLIHDEFTVNANVVAKK